jgi:hypothetical protein
MKDGDNVRAIERGAVLELKLVGDMGGQFCIPRYQRGYRWGKFEVRRLLNDIWHSNGEPYSLQPVVVKRKTEDKWELVDGQQRLTTLYLIFLYMQRENLQNAGPPYSITYDTRPGSESYLQELDSDQRNANIDFYHLYEAYDCIRTWFDGHGPRRQHVANKFYGFLFDSVRVIWYEAPHGLDSTALFTRLNVGRIPLTDAELVKALILSRSRNGEGRSDRSHEIAAQWDGIERELRAPELWSFVTGVRDEDSPTRITLLLDTIAGGPTGRERSLFHTFDTLQQKIDESGPQYVWNEILDLHALVRGWYDNRDLYHKIGYLVAVGHRFGELVPLARDCTKSAFEASLDDHIRRSLDLTPSAVTELSYESAAGRDKCASVLLLMNVETVRRMNAPLERYSFHLYGLGSWSLEHIHAQNAESLTKAEQWKEWLRLHRDALHALPQSDRARRGALIARIDAEYDNIDREGFYNLARDVTDIFTLADEVGHVALHSPHSISNLALLSSADNSALGNSVFEVKRRRILELDRNGANIPICTRRVFLKYYTDALAQQIHFWSTQDREMYLNAMISPIRGMIFNYLKPEDHAA